MLYNKIYESISKGVYESLFDSEFDELSNTGNEDFDVMSDFVKQEQIKVLTELINDKAVLKSLQWYHILDKVSLNICDNIASFSYINKSNNNKEMMTLLCIEKSGSVLASFMKKFINALSILGIKYIALEITLRNTDINSQVEVDFNNILFNTYTLTGITPKNIYMDSEVFKNDKTLSDIMGESDFFSNGHPSNFLTNILFVNCSFAYLDTITIKHVDNVLMQSPVNLKDYSFIKGISTLFSNTFIHPNNLPESNSLQGLPDGNYIIKIYYGESSNRNDTEFKTMPTQTLVGAPKNALQISIYTIIHPSIILQHISLEGITPDMLNKLNLLFRGFGGRTNRCRVQFGPYNLLPKGRRWKPTKPLLETVLKTLDWFIDCYIDKPHKTYILPDNDITNKVIDKEQRKIDLFNQSVKDKEEDREKIIARIKKYIKLNTCYYDSPRKYRYISVTNFDDKHVTITMNNYNNYCYTYDYFINIVRYGGYLYDINATKLKTLYEVIIKPVENKREKIIKQRKQEEKDKRKQETIERREAKKKELKLKKEQEKQKKTGSFDKAVVKVIKKKEELPKLPLSKNTTNNNDIVIEDYSDKSIAIFGNCWKIKEELKKAGCGYNKFLTRNGKKEPGWIASKKKRAEIEKIIKNA